MPLQMIFEGVYGRRSDGSIWIDVPYFWPRRDLPPTARFARMLIEGLRDEAIEGLIVARVRGIPQSQKEHPWEPL